MKTHDPAIEHYLALSPRRYPRVSAVELRYARASDAPLKASLRLVLASADDEGAQLVLRFDRVQKLRLLPPEWSALTISYLSITPMGDRGMEGIGYRVHDEEEDSLDLLCESFTCAIEGPRGF